MASNDQMSSRSVGDISIMLTRDQLVGLSNSVNEVSSWLDERDCETRIGLTLQELRHLQSYLQTML